MDCLVGKSMLIKSLNCIVKLHFTWAGVVSHPDAGNQQQRKTERKKMYINTQMSPAFSSIEISKIATATQRQACFGAMM
jgi:hypothetical protein